MNGAGSNNESSVNINSEFLLVPLGAVSVDRSEVCGALGVSRGTVG